MKHKYAPSAGNPKSEGLIRMLGNNWVSHGKYVTCYFANIYIYLQMQIVAGGRNI